jgi:hypothetical protein
MKGRRMNWRRRPQLRVAVRTEEGGDVIVLDSLSIS